jgi:hypothetical protein
MLDVVSVCIGGMCCGIFPDEFRGIGAGMRPGSHGGASLGHGTLSVFRDQKPLYNVQ